MSNVNPDVNTKALFQGITYHRNTRNIVNTCLTFKQRLFYMFYCSGMSRHLFSVEQKKVTHGLRMLLSVEGGRYMASEKQVSNNLSSSALKVEKHTRRTRE